MIKLKHQREAEINSANKKKRFDFRQTFLYKLHLLITTTRLNYLRRFLSYSTCSLLLPF
jgi:hypothetical protein